MGALAVGFQNQRAALVPQGCIAVTPSDTVNLATPIRGFMVTTAGPVSVLMLDGSTAVWPGLTPGVQYMGAIARINATGTTVLTGIIGLL